MKGVDPPKIVMRDKHGVGEQWMKYRETPYDNHPSLGRC